jgi:hypothetical protein
MSRCVSNGHTSQTGPDKMRLQRETIVTDRAPREASLARNLIFYSYPIRTTPHVSPPDISLPLSSLLCPHRIWDLKALAPSLHDAIGPLPLLHKWFLWMLAKKNLDTVCIRNCPYKCSAGQASKPPINSISRGGWLNETGPKTVHRKLADEVNRP